MNKLIITATSLLLMPSIKLNAAEVLKELKNAKNELIAGKAEIKTGKQDVQDGYWKIKNDVINPSQEALNDLQSGKNTVKSAYDICKEVNSALKGLKYTVVLSPVANTAMGIFGNTPDVVGGILTIINTIEQTLANVKATIEPTIEPINPETSPDIYAKFDQAEQDFDTAIQLLDQIVGDLTTLFEAV